MLTIFLLCVLATPSRIWYCWSPDLTASFGDFSRRNGVVHAWISSYLANRTQYVRCPGSSRSSFSRLDYGSATFAGLPKQLTDRLQSGQNTAAQLIFKAGRQDHIQSLLRRLHRLRMPERVSFRLAVLVSLPPRLCTWLPGSSARVTPQRTSTTALFDYISAGRSTHCAFCHWRPHLSSDCCIGLEQFARVGPVVSVVASFSQQNENRTFCPVLQS